MSSTAYATVALTMLNGTTVDEAGKPKNATSAGNIASQLLTPEASCKLSVTGKPNAFKLFIESAG